MMRIRIDMHPRDIGAIIIAIMEVGKSHEKTAYLFRDRIKYLENELEEQKAAMNTYMAERIERNKDGGLR